MKKRMSSLSAIVATISDLLKITHLLQFVTETPGSILTVFLVNANLHDDLLDIVALVELDDTNIHVVHSAPPLTASIDADLFFVSLELFENTRFCSKEFTQLLGKRLVILQKCEPHTLFCHDAKQKRMLTNLNGDLSLGYNQFRQRPKNNASLLGRLDTLLKSHFAPPNELSALSCLCSDDHGNVKLEDVTAKRATQIAAWNQRYAAMLRASAGTITNDNIPPLLHMIWFDYKNGLLGKKVPQKFLQHIRRAHQTNPELKLKIWSYADVLSLIDEHYDNDMMIFFTQTVKPLICQCDVARILILAVHGGIYADVDFYFSKNVLSRIPQDVELLCFPEIIEHVEKARQWKKNIKGMLYNGFILSKPQHPFILGYVKYLRKHFVAPKELMDVLTETGPIAFHKYLEQSPAGILPTLGHPADISPFTSTGAISIDYDAAKANVMAYTLWTEGGDWGDTGGAATAEKTPADKCQALQQQKDELLAGVLAVTGVGVILLTTTAVLIRTLARVR
jgi:mannosyltransferase OCH1-like enzyme